MARAKKAAPKAKAKKPAAKAAKKATKKKAPDKPARRATSKSPPRTTFRPAAPQAIAQITVPSGKLAIFDVGLVGYLPREALEPMIVYASVPRDRPLPIVGRRVGQGRFAECWSHVAIALADGDAAVAKSKRIGEAGVDFARLIAIDHDAIEHWRHEDSLDGLADFVFWGRDAGLLARAMSAPSLKDGHGWMDLPLATAEAAADRAGRLKADNHWLLATDFRPHSHHYAALAAARRSPHGAGTIEVGRAQACLFFTSWGDGVYPIFLDSDARGDAIQIRVQLEPAA